MVDLPRAELDRLLEASAAALGLELTWHTGICKGGAYRSPFITVEGQLVPWHPHQNSDQALMLLAELGGISDLVDTAGPAELRDTILRAAAALHAARHRPIRPHQWDDDGCCERCGFDGAEWEWWKKTHEGRARDDVKMPGCGDR